MAPALTFSFTHSNYSLNDTDRVGYLSQPVGGANQQHTDKALTSTLKTLHSAAQSLAINYEFLQQQFRKTVVMYYIKRRLLLMAIYWL